MENLYLNLLRALDMLLDEASVTGAGRRLGLIPSTRWHHRLDADPIHRWLRNTVQGVCREVLA